MKSIKHIVDLTDILANLSIFFGKLAYFISSSMLYHYWLEIVFITILYFPIILLGKSAFSLLFPVM